MKKKNPLMDHDILISSDEKNFSSPKSNNKEDYFFPNKKLRFNSLLSNDIEFKNSNFKSNLKDSSENEDICIYSDSLKNKKKKKIRNDTKRQKSTFNKNMNNYLNKIETLQSMETKTKKRSLRKLRDPINSHTNSIIKNSEGKKMTVSQIYQPNPLKKHQLWLSSLIKNKKQSIDYHNNSNLNPYLNMSSFNISDDISHIFPSNSNYKNSINSNILKKKSFQNKEINIGNDDSYGFNNNYLRNNNSISTIEKEDINTDNDFYNTNESFFADINPEKDFLIKINQSNDYYPKVINDKEYVTSNAVSIYNDKQNMNSFNKSSNTLRLNNNEFTKRILKCRIDAQNKHNNNSFSNLQSPSHSDQNFEILKQLNNRKSVFNPVIGNFINEFK